MNFRIFSTNSGLRLAVYCFVAIIGLITTIAGVTTVDDVNKWIDYVPNLVAALVSILAAANVQTLPAGRHRLREDREQNLGDVAAEAQERYIREIRGE